MTTNHKNRFLQWNGKAIALAMLCSSILFSCQSAEQKQENAIAATEQTAADTVQARPAPTFYIIPPGMERKHVWICEDGKADIFHKKHDCEVLIACKGKGNFRNISLQRAIEEFGRYNCDVCSKDMADIFDEDKIRG